MDTKTFLDIKGLLQGRLPEWRKKYPIGELALFGSVTREDFNDEKSDIDVFIQFNDAIGIEFIDLVDELQKLLGRKVEVISQRGLKPRHWNYLKGRLKYV